MCRSLEFGKRENFFLQKNLIFRDLENFAKIVFLRKNLRELLDARASHQLQPAPSLLLLLPVPHPLTCLDCWPCCPSSPSPGPWRAGGSQRPAPVCSLSSTPSPCTESAYLSRLLALLPLFSISWSMASWREPETSSSLLPLFSSFSLYRIRLPV
jgi:hypothetical protein